MGGIRKRKVSQLGHKLRKNCQQCESRTCRTVKDRTKEKKGEQKGMNAERRSKRNKL